jgi:hypothetical protein
MESNPWSKKKRRQRGVDNKILLLLSLLGVQFNLISVTALSQ